jgi:hypothetical protein
MIDWSFVAPMVLGVVATLTIGGVVILRPLAKKGADLLEAMAHEKREPPRSQGFQDARVVELLEAMNARLERLEDRQDFTDSLLAEPRAEKALPRANG